MDHDYGNVTNMGYKVLDTAIYTYPTYIKTIGRLRT